MKILSKTIQWLFAIFLVLMALTAGSVVSGIIIFIAALLMAPIRPIRQMLLKLKIKNFLVIILSLVLFFIGIAVSPDAGVSNDSNVEDSLVIEEDTTSNINEGSVESTNESNDEEYNSIPEATESNETEKDTTENATSENISKNDETITNKEPTTDKENTTNNTEPTTSEATTAVDPDSQVTVYITKTGKKYHYENPCGNGTYYASTLANAKARGLTPCEKCVLH